MGELQRELFLFPVDYYQSEGLKLLGNGVWRTTRCDFHGGSDSVGINTVTGGFVCRSGCGAKGGDVLACHMAAHGLGFVDAAKALGAYIDNGKPHFGSSKPSSIPA
jgi:hypothetical protein